MAFKMRSPLHNEPPKLTPDGSVLKGYGRVVEETGATKSTLKPKESGPKKKLPQEVYDQLKSFDGIGESGPRSKTPTIDKFMKMNERPSASSSEPSYLDKVKKKAGMVADVVGKATGVSNIPILAEGAKMLVSSKEPKSIIEGPSKRDTQEQKRKQEKAAESADARYELPAPGSMSSPMYLDPKAYGVGNEDTKTSEKDKEVDEETGDIVEDAGETTADKYQKMMDETEESYGDNPFLRGRIDVAKNKAQKARLQGRLDRRLERQEERAKRLNLRNYGNKEGAPTEMKPNRAGRPVNSNMLMTNPVIKTGKHSAKDAVAKLRMRKIAQSE